MAEFPNREVMQRVFPINQKTSQYLINFNEKEFYQKLIDSAILNSIDVNQETNIILFEFQTTIEQLEKDTKIDYQTLLLSLMKIKIDKK